jgi:hypothetical protein
MMRNQVVNANPIISSYDKRSMDSTVGIRQVFPCSVCGNDCYQRCTKCQLMYYCSTLCQKIDWKAGHQRSCNRIGPTNSMMVSSLSPSTSSKRMNPETVLAELCVLARKTPLDVSIQQMSQAQQQVERQLELQQQRRQKIHVLRLENDEMEKEKTVDTSVLNDDDDNGNGDDDELIQITKTTIAATSKASTSSQSQNNSRTHQHHDLMTGISTSISLTPSSIAPTQPPLPPMQPNVSFVVEEMSQIGRYQLTLRIPTTTRRVLSSNQYHDTCTEDNEKILSDINISTVAMTPSKSHTIVIIRESDKMDSTCTTTTTTTTTTSSSSSTQSRQDDDYDSNSTTNGALFVGEFPRQIVASQITWHLQECENDQQQHQQPPPPPQYHQQDGSIGTTNKHNSMMILCVRLPFPIDPSSLFDNTTSTSSSSGKTPLWDVNAVACGSCHLPLLRTSSSSSPPPGEATIPLNGEGRIGRVLPMPVGHWDEIADTLICYNGVRNSVCRFLWYFVFFFGKGCNELLCCVFFNTNK